MQSKLIRIVADDAVDTWGDWAAETTHKRLKRGMLSRFAPTKGQIKAVGAVVANAAGSVFDLFKKSGSEQITLLPISQVNDMMDVDGEALSVDHIYAMHPLRQGVVLKAEVLHAYILKEQRAQIIRYFRHSVALKSLTIEIVSEKSNNYYTGGGWKVASAGFGKDSKAEQRHWFTATYNTPRREIDASIGDLFWMSHFDEIIAATKNTAGGSVESITTLNTSFGISAAAASIANIDTNWISNQSFVIKAEYA